MVDWDKWREDYPHLTWEQQLRWYENMEQHCPSQLHYDRTAADLFLSTYDPAKVLEIGGWKGELALDMLDVHPHIAEWLNIEIITAAKEFEQGRYKVLIPDDYIWRVGMPQGYDVLIMSHSLEHMTPDNLGEVVGQTDVRAIYVDAPLLQPGETWAGYVGTHIFDQGWDGVDKIMRTHGFRVYHRQESGRHPVPESRIAFYQRL